MIEIRPSLPPSRSSVCGIFAREHETWRRFQKILEDLVASYADAEVSWLLTFAFNVC